MTSDPDGFALEEADMEHWAYEYAYKDGRINVSALVNDLEIPTIGLLNGPGFHAEIVPDVRPHARRGGRHLSTCTTTSARCPPTASTTPSRNCSA